MGNSLVKDKAQALAFSIYKSADDLSAGQAFIDGDVKVI